MEFNPRIKIRKMLEDTTRICQEITGHMINWLTKINEIYFGAIEVDKGKKNKK